jgi:hypothetical protein
MTYLRMIAAALLLILASIASGETIDPVTSESRDASTAYLGTSNFVVGRIGRDCLALLNRPETPQAFVSTWQERNAKYLMASQKYMVLRLAEAETSGGPETKNAVISALSAVVQNGAESIVKSWIDRPDKIEACKFAVALIESGAYDVSSSSPMYDELENLVSWAQQ